MKRRAWIIAALTVALLLFCACSKPERFSERKPGTKNLSTGENAAEILYPLEGKTARLDGGATFAVQEGFRIRYINTENELIREIELSAESLSFASDCVFSNRGIFMGIDDRGPEGTGTAVCFVGGEWKLYGGVFFDREGNIVRELPYVVEKTGGNGFDDCRAVLSTGETIDYYEDALPVTKARWVGEDVMAIFDSRGLFFYRISEDRLYLSLDISKPLSGGSKPDEKANTAMPEGDRNAHEEV